MESERVGPQPEPGSGTSYSIVTEGLTRVFGRRTVVDHLSLRVAKGTFFGFLGPNGAGKTTTLRMLVGLLRPTSGRVVVAGHDIAREPLEVKRRIGVLPEELNLYERLTGTEFLEFAGRMYGLDWEEAAERTEELLGLMELTDDRDKMIVDYSHGMKKKVALAAAIIHDPQVVFLDEPFEGIDAVSARAIREVLRRSTERGATIFFSSHILDVVERLCTEVGVLNEGRLVAQGTLEELRSRRSADESLEDIFLRLVGAQENRETLSWLQ